MKIIARMVCSEAKDATSGETANPTKYGENVSLYPVYSSDPASPNYSFTEATPSGKLEMFISNKQAWGAFVVGKEYDIEINPTVKA